MRRMLTRLKYLIQQVTNLKQTLVQVLVNLLIGLEVIINAEEFFSYRWIRFYRISFY